MIDLFTHITIQVFLSENWYWHMTTKMQRNDLWNINAKDLLNTEKNKALIYWASEWTKYHGLAGPQDAINKCNNYVWHNFRDILANHLGALQFWWENELLINKY